MSVTLLIDMFKNLTVSKEPGDEMEMCNLNKIKNLPSEILDQITGYLTASELVRLTSTSRHFCILLRQLGYHQKLQNVSRAVATIQKEVHASVNYEEYRRNCLNSSKSYYHRYVCNAIAYTLLPKATQSYLLQEHEFLLTVVTQEMGGGHKIQKIRCIGARITEEVGTTLHMALEYLNDLLQRKSSAWMQVYYYRLPTPEERAEEAARERRENAFNRLR